MTVVCCKNVWTGVPKNPLTLVMGSVKGNDSQEFRGFHFARTGLEPSSVIFFLRAS